MIWDRGSSPHARGTRSNHAISLPCRRFIPTRAGNTHYGLNGSAGKSVHPHTRGEHYAGRLARMENDGSSPHARGTREAGAEQQVKHRFIPTRAGNTLIDPTSTIHSSVHPHTRGEHGSIPCRRG